jgi:hypothetical protein
MALGIVLPAWLAGILAVAVYAVAADLQVVSGLIVFFGASMGTCGLLLLHVALGCRPWRILAGGHALGTARSDPPMAGETAIASGFDRTGA